MSVHDRPLDQNDTWPFGVIEDKNVVAAHNLRYHQVSRREDSTDYHREMRDVFSQRPFGFYENNMEEAKKPSMDVKIKADEPAPVTVSEPLGSKIASTASEVVTSRLLLIIDMVTWQVPTATLAIVIVLKLKSFLADR